MDGNQLVYQSHGPVFIPVRISQGKYLLLKPRIDHILFLIAGKLLTTVPVNPTFQKYIL